MKQPIIYALGFFDGVHLGHQALLKACRELADQYGFRAGVVTFVNHPDALVQGNAPRLINSLSDRKRLLKEFHMDELLELPFDEALRSMSWLDFLLMLRHEHDANGFVCGADFRFGHRGSGTAELLQEYCQTEWLPCAIVPEQKMGDVTVSSTHIRRLLEAGEVEEAGRFLGHPHILSGEVVSGRQLGRTIGIPTANLILPAEVLCPKHGVYACVAGVEGKRYAAVTNIGSRPTVGGNRVTVEPWLLDFSGDLYGKKLRLELHAFLREERKFGSLEELKEAILENEQQTRMILRNVM
jgi:riboflavin kinase/FMN adenylyltransferase